MPAHVLIVEGDTALSTRLRATLEQRGHTVEETSDGRRCLDLARARRPGVVILAVELPGGQNGYLLVGKLRKDEELKTVPIVIVGSPEGFAAHARLKNRADEYLAKPLDLPVMLATVGRLTGDAGGPPRPPEDEDTVSGDPDLDLIDAAFDDSPRARPTPRPPPPRAAPAPPAELAEDDFSGLGGDEDGPTMVGLEALSETPLPLTEATPAPALPREPGDLENQVARLQSALDDAQARAFTAEVRANQLEAQLQETPAAQPANRESRGSEQLEQELAAAYRDLELSRAHAEGAEMHLSSFQERAERAEAELADLRQRADAATGQGEELESIRARVVELETDVRKHEDRVTRLYARLKTEERVREKARKAVAVAGQLLADPRPTAGEPEGEEDEPAVVS